MSGESQWEYKVVQWVGNVWGTSGNWELPELADMSTEQVLNHFGVQGWEFHSIGPVHNETGKIAAAYIFKRGVA